MKFLLFDLLNSQWHDYRGSGAQEDRIDQDRWLGGFLQRAGWGLKRLPDPAERGALKTLRAQVRGVVEGWCQGRPLLPDPRDEFNRILARAPLVRQIDPSGRFTLRPAACDIQSVMGEVAASLATLLAEGDPRRVKVCANLDCGWLFYDESRNLSRRWCSSRHCGNLVKVRNFRKRKRTLPNPPGHDPGRRSPQNRTPA
jgi:predicted RNA-binding Zn ribbon-like protein